MISETDSLRCTVLYLIYMTYWLQKKYGKGGLPPTSPDFKQFTEKNYKPAVQIPPRTIPECMILPMEGFINFVLDSDFRSNLNREFPKGGLIIVQGLSDYSKKRKSKLNKALKEFGEDPSIDVLVKLKNNFDTREMITPELFSYHVIFFMTNPLFQSVN